MKILKLKLFQESACYKKPFAFKVSETYPLPPYSTVIGMFHKILNANPGEYFDMNISIQGDFDSIFNNYQTLRSYKDKEVTKMPRNVHQLLNVSLIIHVEADDEIIDKIYYNIINGESTFTLGRNEDIVRLDEVKILTKKPKLVTDDKDLETKNNFYIPINKVNSENSKVGIKYRLNTKYVIDKNNLRDWEKVDVVYVEKKHDLEDDEIICDEDKDLIFFYK